MKNEAKLRERRDKEEERKEREEWKMRKELGRGKGLEVE